MKHTIGTFSNMLGVSTDTLRLYEKFGVLLPQKDDKNNYRYYDDLDARNLLTCKWYRSLDFSLKDAAALTCNASESDIKSALAQKARDLTTQLESLQKMCLVIQETQALLSEDHKPFSLKTLPGLYRFQQTEVNTLLFTDTIETNQWMEQLPETLYSFKALLDSENPYTWGMAIPEMAFKKAKLSLTPEIEYIPPTRYLCMLHKSYGDEPLINLHFEPLRFEAIKRELAIGNYVFGHLIVSYNEGKKRVNLIQLMLPIEVS